MALDTDRKRAAVTGTGRPFNRSTFPSLLKDEEWRATAGNVYPVADFQSPVAQVFPSSMVDNLVNPLRDLVIMDSMTNPWWEDFPP